MNELEKRREKWRVSQASYRLRKRLEVPAAPFRLSTALNTEQKAALVMALQAYDYAAKRRQHSSLKGNGAKDSTIGALKGRRREQCRVNQANYRKHQQETRLSLITEIEVLEKDIERLEALKEHQQLRCVDPTGSISEFYHMLGLPVEEQPFSMVELQRYERTHGYSPALQVQLDLQREEFDSMESLVLHWRWYRTQFREFEYSMKSCERLNAGEHVIIKVVGEVRLSVFSRTGSKASTIVCPVVQQFEFQEGVDMGTRITSEVDFVSGSLSDQSGPEQAMIALQRVSESFCLTWKMTKPVRPVG